jgi:hypothetical protein
LKRFVLPLFIIIGLNYLLNEWFLYINKDAVIWELDNEFYKNVDKKKVKYLIIGNSHSFGIETYENDSLLHFATYGENWAKSYYKLKYQIKKKLHHYSHNFKLGLVCMSTVVFAFTNDLGMPCNTCWRDKTCLLQNCQS